MVPKIKRREARIKALNDYLPVEEIIQSDSGFYKYLQVWADSEGDLLEGAARVINYLLSIKNTSDRESWKFTTYYDRDERGYVTLCKDPYLKAWGETPEESLREMAILIRA